MDLPFVGSDALDRGHVANKHQLRTRYRALFPDVYLTSAVPVPTLRQRTMAAWLWSGSSGVVAGLAAAALHGSKWVDDDEPIELVCRNARTPAGLVARRDTLAPGEVTRLGRMHVTTPERTAFDLARLRAEADAVARLDALCNATGLTVAGVRNLARNHRGVRGIRRVGPVLDLVDPGAQSPRETWLRLLLLRAGFPSPRTQLPVFHGGGRRPRYYLDLAWEEVMVAAEYDGDQHRADRERYGADIKRLEALTAMGWTMIRVVSGDRPADIVDRVRAAWAARSTTGAPSVR
ncbi:hypothetical protein [Mycolicibacterium palauense]|uniref:hypothetical protein n=1 Tax=Mycolicibacterium palauense TaxID=2034511 RepID=UPI000BFF07AD|nr:hypothetical protein [Mycolicibacterium palauense]